MFYNVQRMWLLLAKPAHPKGTAWVGNNTTKARLVHHADKLKGYSMMLQDPSFHKIAIMTQILHSNSNIVIWITKEWTEDFWLSLKSQCARLVKSD